MGKSYSHLKEQDRIFLRVMLEKNYSKTKIAKTLNVDRSTVYREIKRNSYIHSYSKQSHYESYFAQQKYLKRRKRLTKLAMLKKLRDYVHEKLSKGWSPWQIEGRLKLERGGQCVISHETIYRYIYSNYNVRNRFYKKLRRKHLLRIKHHSRTPRVPPELLIKHGDATINSRSDFGHWEADLMIFKREHGTANLITLRERKSRFMVAIKNANKCARNTAVTIISTMKKLKLYIKSITFDQGSEFQKYLWIKNCLGADIYFCEPASPHQKGAIENGNGVIRVELPRSFNINAIEQKTISKLTHEIDGRPLKCLQYQTPAEVFAQYVVNYKI